MAFSREKKTGRKVPAKPKTGRTDNDAAPRPPPVYVSAEEIAADVREVFGERSPAVELSPRPLNQVAAEERGKVHEAANAIACPGPSKDAAEDARNFEHVCAVIVALQQRGHEATAALDKILVHCRSIPSCSPDATTVALAKSITGVILQSADAVREQPVPYVGAWEERLWEKYATTTRPRAERLEEESTP